VVISQIEISREGREDTKAGSGRVLTKRVRLERVNMARLPMGLGIYIMKKLNIIKK
jgi:hypothetical protein